MGIIIVKEKLHGTDEVDKENTYSNYYSRGQDYHIWERH